MIREHGDVAVLGAGLAGSIMALVLQRIGRTVVLLERGVHPRFAIGESSTPLANLALEEISRTYDLPQLFALSAYGTWLQAYPHLAVGLKRGFTFMRHQAGQPFRPSPEHANELLVAASPADDVADTHWFREHFDHFLVQQAQSAGIPYHDRTDIASIERQRQRLAAARPTGRRADRSDGVVPDRRQRSRRRAGAGAGAGHNSGSGTHQFLVRFLPSRGRRPIRGRGQGRGRQPGGLPLPLRRRGPAPSPG